MARTKASVGAKVAAVKSVKARCAMPPPSASARPSTSGLSKHRSYSGGGNRVCRRDTPIWQKPITHFFFPETNNSDEETESDKIEKMSRPKRNIIMSDEESSPEKPKNGELEESFELEQLNGENSHKIDEYFASSLEVECDETVEGEINEQKGVDEGKIVENCGNDEESEEYYYENVEIEENGDSEKELEDGREGLKIDECEYHYKIDENCNLEEEFLAKDRNGEKIKENGHDNVENEQNGDKKSEEVDLNGENKDEFSVNDRSNERITENGHGDDKTEQNGDKKSKDDNRNESKVKHKGKGVGKKTKGKENVNANAKRERDEEDVENISKRLKYE